jgi:hypothetical protein
MAQVLKFVVSMPVSTALPRDRISNTFHMEHVAAWATPDDIEGLCSDIVAMYQARYHNATHEIQCKAYDIDNPPNFPRADVIVNAGSVWPNNHPRESCLCLSFAGDHRGNRRERGRLYLQPGIDSTLSTDMERPNATVQQWALDFYSVSNESFPDLGGIDIKFGIYSALDAKFTQSKQAWVDDEWDTQRRRGLRGVNRLTSSREG